MSKKVASHKSRPGLKMQALVEATGVPKSTILHYLHKGLLPEPLKTSPNMAYYDPGCIDLIKFIQHMQQNHRLSLAQIRKRLEGKVDDPGFSLHLELHDLIFGKGKQEKLLDEKNFCMATGLKKDQVRELKRARLLMPLIENRFDQEDVRMGQLYAKAGERGLRIEDTTYYVKYGEKIVDHEMALRRRVTRHLPWDQDASRTMDLVRNARMLRAYIIDRLFQHRVAAMKGIKETEEESC